ncbi:hypothetical protein F2Q68_00017024 [Brassica cretica]|nr:hypothetical protein F2Q68_00017024 [Brassica cretica]
MWLSLHPVYGMVRISSEAEPDNGNFWRFRWNFPVAQLELFAIRRWHQSFGAALAGKPISAAEWSHISSKVSSPFGNAFIWSTSNFCYAS